MSWSRKRTSGLQRMSAATASKAEDIAEIVAMWTGIPVVQLTQEESERLLHLEDTLHKRVIGQDEAVTAIARPSAAAESA